MLRLGILLAVLGFGSAALHFSGYQFKLLMWAEPAQPVLGLVLGLVGVAAVVAGVVSNRAKRASVQSPQAPYGGPPPQSFRP